MIERLRKISYFFAYAVATIPLWHYIRDGRILAGMVAIVLFAYVMVVLSSVQAAQPILSSEKAKISLPRWLPDRPKYQKWWMIVRRTLKWHLLLVPPKMGLALGLVHWLRSIVRISSKLDYHRNFLLNPYIYLSHTGLIYKDIYPYWHSIPLALILSILFTFAGSILLSAILRTCLEIPVR